MRNRRSGSLLIVAVVAAAVATMLSLSLAAILRASAKTSDEGRYRRETRQACRNAVLIFAAEHLVSDTNGWDAATEEWGEPWERRAEEWVLRVSGDGWQTHAAATKGVRDESSCIPLGPKAQPLLAALLHVAAGIPDDTALDLARQISDKGPYACSSHLAANSGLTDKEFEAIAPHVTLFPTERVNINTAPEKVLEAVFHAAGTLDAGANRMLLSRIRAFRKAGNAFTSATPASVARSLGGLPADEMLVLANSQDWLTVESDIFSGVAEATPARFWEIGRAPGRATFTFDRGNARFLRWVEE
jgi:type II secretory pathway component PulK